MKKHKAPLRCRIRRKILGPSPLGMSLCAIGGKCGKSCGNCEMNWVQVCGDKIVKGFQDGIKRGLANQI